MQTVFRLPPDTVTTPTVNTPISIFFAHLSTLSDARKRTSNSPRGPKPLAFPRILSRTTAHTHVYRSLTVCLPSSFSHRPSPLLFSPLAPSVFVPHRTLRRSDTRYPSRITHATRLLTAHRSHPIFRIFFPNRKSPTSLSTSLPIASLITCTHIPNQLSFSSLDSVLDVPA